MAKLARLGAELGGNLCRGAAAVQSSKLSCETRREARHVGGQKPVNLGENCEMEGKWRGEGYKGVCSLFGACVSVSGISRGCDPEVTAKPLPWREAGGPQRGGRNAEQRGEASGEHLGIRARWQGGSRRRRIYCWPGGVRGMESFRSGVAERKEDMAKLWHGEGGICGKG